MDALFADIKYAVRYLLAKPGTTFVAVATLAIGIGANTAIFSVVNGVLLEPLPYDEPHELVVVWQDLTRVDGPATEWATPDNFFDWRDQNEAFDGMFALSNFGPTLSGGVEPELLAGAQTSYNAFSLLGVEPILGRGFAPEDDTAASELVVLLSHSLFQRRFGGSPEAIGSGIRLDAEPATVIGVLPPGFELPMIENAEIFAPLRIDRTNTCGRGCYTLRVIARLSDRVSLERARADLSTIAARLERDYPDTNTGVGIHLVSLKDQLVGDVRVAIWVLFGAVGLVLLIGCANVASLMLARAADREREVATRVAMGASRVRLVRQLLTEGFLLAAAGAAVGLVLALWGVDVLVSLVRDDVPRAAHLAMDSHALFFTVGISSVTGFVFGLAPAWHASRPSLQGSLREGLRGSARAPLRRALVVAEVALALTLLVAASLLLRSFAALIEVDPGLDPEGVLTAQLNLVGPGYDETTRRSDFVRRLLARVKSLPGVENAGVIYVLPMGGNNSDANFLIEGREPPEPHRTPVAWYRPASPDYFETMRMSLVRGRWFQPGEDAEAPPVVLINETAARRYWPNEDPLQSRVRVGGKYRQVVGIVSDTKHFGLDQDERSAMYFPYEQLPLRFMSLVVRTSEDPTLLISPVRDAVWEIDPVLAVAQPSTMQDVIAATVAPPRTVTMLLSVFAAAALALAAIGLYGVMSYAVAQRTREIGIRMALGAKAGDVLRWAVGDGMLLLGIGSLLGLGASLVATRLMESLLFSVSPTDPMAFVGSLAVLVAVALSACYLPARRASRVDPLVALHHE
ncbi:MAG TPA: ABC transporter permease [Vicinamibacteria bacterium]|nr:ABC transporter permease [Vicinamibacteria bacterium]